MISSNVVSKDILRKVQSGTLSRAKAHLIQSFGPMGSYTCVGKGGGKAIKYTKDGHSILSELSFTRPIEATVIDALTDITRNTVKTVGDGTTSAVVLSSIIFEKMTELETRHKLPPSKMIDVFKKVVSNITEVVESGKKETAVEDIYKIAYVSTNGNEEVANVIRDIYEDYGMEVFIDVAISADENSHIKIYDGMTMEVGYAESCFINHPKGVANINHPNVYAFQDPIDTPEMVSFLDQIIHDNIILPYGSQDPNIKPVATVIIAPKISRDFATRMDQITDYMAKADYASKPPLLIITNITDQAQFLDIADMCGAKLIKKYNDPRIQELDIQNGLCATLETVHQFAGQCEMVESSNTKSKFINPALMFDENGEHSERFKALISWLEAELAKAYEEGLTTTDVVKLKRRINSLKANLVEYQIGGISISDRDSLRDLVEDAVLNCRSAAKYGYGYGANFEALRASKQVSKMYHTQDSTALYRDIADALYEAYLELSSDLYETYTVDVKMAADIVSNSLAVKGCPFNIRTESFDGNVLSSIKSDIAILESISKIVTIMFTCNQFICDSSTTAFAYTMDDDF